MQKLFDVFAKPLSKDKVDAIYESVTTASEAQDGDAAWAALAPLLRAQPKQLMAAQCLVTIADKGLLSIERAVEVLSAIYDAHKDDADIVASIGKSLESARDIDQLNAAPPTAPLFSNVIDRLNGFIKAADSETSEESLVYALATASRMVGRQRDDVAHAMHQRLIELDSKNAPYRYTLGLFCKTRGLFEAGMIANQAAVNLKPETVDSYEWNLGICATGAKHGAVALEVWQRMGQKIGMGRFGLPEGGYPNCKVRLAQRPLAARTADNDYPGLEETIWIERLSPCHGIVRSVLVQQLGVDFGDVVLIDGAPITYHTYGDNEVPVFPHLATLVKGGYQFFDFAGTQDASGQLEGISEALTEDTIVYSHTENYRTLCMDCWHNPDIDHEEHRGEDRHVVTGRIAAPPTVEAEQLLQQIDGALVELNACHLYSPTLCHSAGQEKRAGVEQRRFDLLTNN
ncbi:MAG: prenyltransferase [Gammaproteobacteria bacterium]